VVKEADALHEAGFRVTVVATRTLEEVDRRDEVLIHRAAWEVERVDLRSRIGWWKQRLPQAATRAVFAATDCFALAARGFSAFTSVLTRVVLQKPADLYIAHYPASLPAAAAAARRHGARYAYDAEDFHLGDWPDKPNYELDRRLVRVVESTFLPGSAYVTAASPGIADAYAEAYRITRPSVVLNVFPVERGAVSASPRGTVEPRPSVYWFSQTIGPDRGLECALQAIGHAQTRPHLYLRGALANGFADRLRALVSEAGAQDRLHLLAPAPPDEMERLAAAYDVGLSSETAHTQARRLCLSNKLFSYLAAGVPPLLSMTPAQRAFASEAGLEDLTYPPGDASALAELMDGVLGSTERLATARERVFWLARSRFNWDCEKEIFCSIVRSAGLSGAGT
jgi:glycosyltransferase involved in cell wall biosynthesis